ncbi:MAG: hypothetical protein GTN90_14360 [Xanthomonadales bacterium]|nr:hypothetical protein [Xanthomonadales bacterium]
MVGRTGHRLGCVGFSAALIAAPQTAQAHAFAERYDLPLPLGFYLAGAGAAVAMSFLGSFLLMRLGRTSLPMLDIPIPRGLAVSADAAVRVLGLALLALVVIIGLFGPQSPTQNFATVFIWVIWWVGLTLASALVIDVFSPGNPFRTLGRWLDDCRRASERSLSPSWGWLAVAGLLAVGWFELVSDHSEDPRAMVALVGAYCAVLLVGTLWAGAGPWFTEADPLTRLFALLGRCAPLATPSGALRLRAPASGLVGLEVSVPGAVFIICLIAMVLFDGLSETPAWAGLLDWITRSTTLRPWLLDLRGAGVDILKLIRTFGLLGMAILCVMLYAGLTATMGAAVGGRVPVRRLFTGFAASLLPIAVAYHLAHYVSYFALAAQLMLPILSDPMGWGWNLFGTANRRVDIGVVDAQSVWWIAAAALIAGHALSVFVAHAEALRILPDHRSAIRSQLPMMVFMVGLTSLSLWILAQPIVA